VNPLLAGAYGSLKSHDFDVAHARFEEDEENEPDRYQSWRSLWEQTWDLITKSSTSKPLTDSEIQSDRPWRKIYRPFVCLDPNPRVDLRKAPIECVVDTWQQPTCTLQCVSKEGAEGENHVNASRGTFCWEETPDEVEW
jgi:hypothetical protein